MAMDHLIAVWHDAAQRTLVLLRGLSADDWNKPTDCPDWTVRDVAAHLAAIESELAGLSEPLPADDEASLPESYTQRGVDARSELPGDALVTELTDAIEQRHKQLLDLDIDPSGKPDRSPGGVSWPWQLLMANRAVDLWVHEQDIREAVGDPGGMDATGAAHTIAVFRGVLPYVLGKLVSPPAGTSVRWTVTGTNGFDIAVRIADDGRAYESDDIDSADAQLTMTDRAFARRVAGRRDADDLGITGTGDVELARRVLKEMSVVT